MEPRGDKKRTRSLASQLIMRQRAAFGLRLALAECYLVARRRRRRDWANTRRAPDFSIPWQRLLADCKILRRSAAATAQAKAKLISFRIAHWGARCREEHGWFYSHELEEFGSARRRKRCVSNATRRIEWGNRVAPCQNPDAVSATSDFVENVWPKTRHFCFMHLKLFFSMKYDNPLWVASCVRKISIFTVLYHTYISQQGNFWLGMRIAYIASWENQRIYYVLISQTLSLH
jgi:hypothetical protein